MNIQDVKQDIKDKKIRPYYIFSGDEIEIQRIYVNKIANVLGYPVTRVDCISDVWSTMTSPSLFNEYSVYVVRDDKDLMNNETVQSQIDNGAIGKNILIHLVTIVDKRTKWYKSNSSRIIEFERLSTAVLKKYIQKRVTLNNANCERLIAICENDYCRILLEIDKIIWFAEYNHDPAMGYTLSYDDVFEKLLQDGTIFQPAHDAIFDLVDAILKRQINRVYNLLYQSYAVGEANMVILSVLYNNAKQVLQVQSCESSDICKSTGLSSWQVKCAKDKCGFYSIGELVNILREIQKIQKGIIIGQIDDSLSVEYLLVNIL